MNAFIFSGLPLKRIAHAFEVDSLPSAVDILITWSREALTSKDLIWATNVILNFVVAGS